MTERVTGSPGRRALLGAAVLSTAALGLTGTAHAAERGRGGHSGGHGPLRDLPVPTVIGHRGASGYRPEHTLGSYQLALDLGAHIVEQDLVPTKDGHLVCRHENDITGTTDVADHPEFAGRKATKSIDGVSYTGWFTEDFTLAELKTLRAEERIPGNRPDNTLYDGRWTIPTFEEVLRWADKEGRKRGKPVWLYVETKHPTYFRSLGLGLEEPLARLLRRYGRDRKNSPLILQSFEPTSIQRLARLVATPRVVLLSGPTTRPWDFVESGDPRTVADLVKPAGLKWIASYAQGIGPTLDLVIPKDAAGRLTRPTTLVKDAHARGLLLHPYTLRNENSFLPADFRRGTDPNAYGDVFGAAAAYLATGIDGIFADHPDTALLAAADFKGR
ncbi:glycerophosphodiester phosphodiesterase [Streptomyces microflavus]|uniref:glycerophosphodiester phosphodiesterase n=1 Tax=Streptomyces microflavus TaxID=1919 RepID=A0A7J0CJG9_STRMI|nr:MULTISPECIES: glycerophosphodiester phosphodiesterase [Streptomyces]MDX2980298.1 glycerophosphodiester phosphodiesterase [Streptomyces sp. NRRL_B-2249]GFN02632.1 glycerophosphoryl diester phosphodiesterase [Streptomyces microflavus]GGX87519.1 glycerophosphoryl diester phosphodiesterase [Streptomyces microflavus]